MRLLDIARYSDFHYFCGEHWNGDKNPLNKKI